LADPCFIQDGDFVMAESVAMMRYLAREKKVADHWYPKAGIVCCQPKKNTGLSTAFLKDNG
jgi:hypothetical protein